MTLVGQGCLPLIYLAKGSMKTSGKLPPELPLGIVVPNIMLKVCAISTVPTNRFTMRGAKVGLDTMIGTCVSKRHGDPCITAAGPFSNKKE